MQEAGDGTLDPLPSSFSYLAGATNLNNLSDELRGELMGFSRIPAVVEVLNVTKELLEVVRVISVGVTGCGECVVYRITFLLGSVIIDSFNLGQKVIGMLNKELIE